MVTAEFLRASALYLKARGIGSITAGLIIPKIFESQAITIGLVCIGWAGAAFSGVSMFMLKRAVNTESECTILWALDAAQIFIQVVVGPKLSALPPG